MEIGKLVLDYVKALAWPIVTFAIAWRYKADLIGLLGRLQKADLPGGVHLDFAQKAQEVKQLSEHVEPLPVKSEQKALPAIPLTQANARLISLGLQPSPSGLDMEYYRTLALRDPNIALAGLRIEIDTLARNLAKGFHISVGERDSGRVLLEKLFKGSALSASQFELAKKVLSLCNAAVHGTPVSRGEADTVIDSADVLAQQYLGWLSWGFPERWSSQS